MSRSLSGDVRGVGGRIKRAVSGFPGWLGGVLAGLQGALLPYVAILILAFAVLVSSPVPEASATDWSGAFSIASTVWLMGHGLPLTVQGVTITLLPLGITILAAAAIAALARRFASRSWASWALVVITYVASVEAVAILSLRGDPHLTAHAVRVGVVAALIAAPSAALGIWRAHGAEFGWLPRVPESVRRGIRRGLAMAALVVCASAVAALAFAVVGRDAIAQSATGLSVDGVGGVVLAIAETAYAPVMVIWMIAWMTGQGFSVGAGTAYAPDAITTDALPHVPILGALPSAAGGLLVWVPLVIVVIGLAVRWRTRRRSHVSVADAVADGVAVTVALMLLGFATWLGTGTMGPERLETVGADLVPVLTWLGMLLVLGMGVATGLQSLEAVIRDRRRPPRSRGDIPTRSRTDIPVRRSPGEAQAAAQRASARQKADHDAVTAP